MRRTTRSAVVVVAIALVTGFSVTAPANAQGRANDWVEVWCDANTTNTDGNTITLSVDAAGITHGGPDDVRAKVVDASAFDPGMKDSNHFNARAGVVQGWWCGALRYADGDLTLET